MDLDTVLKTLERSTKIAGDTLTLLERTAGHLGRGGSKWHRWRTLRLRLRAALLASRAPTKSKALLTSAAIHLAHAITLETRAGRDLAEVDAASLAALVRGIEPLAGRS